MRVLITGNGGREDALAAKLALDPRVEKIFCASTGVNLLENGVRIPVCDAGEALSLARKERVDLAIAGAENLLADGIGDLFRMEGISFFGPGKEAARLESSKAFAKKFMEKNGIRTAAYREFTECREAIASLGQIPFPTVIKADGLAAGKGVVIAQTRDEAAKALTMVMEDRAFGSAGDKVVIEEYIDGDEVSILSLTDCQTIVPMVSSMDHKQLNDHDEGPNTGGMGVIAPNPIFTNDIEADFKENILEPTLCGLRSEGFDFAGFIYFGVMVRSGKCYLLEYNMRMGDPETQAILPLLDSSFLDPILLAGEKRLEKARLEWLNGASCAIVLAAEGYPFSPKTGFPITGLDRCTEQVYFSAVKEDKSTLLTAGGRVLTVVSVASTPEDARRRAYLGVDAIHFENRVFRRDIGIRRGINL